MIYELAGGAVRKTGSRHRRHIVYLIASAEQRSPFGHTYAYDIRRAAVAQHAVIYVQLHVVGANDVISISHVRIKVQVRCKIRNIETVVVSCPVILDQQTVLFLGNGVIDPFVCCKMFPVRNNIAFDRRAFVHVDFFYKCIFADINGLAAAFQFS